MIFSLLKGGSFGKTRNADIIEKASNPCGTGAQQPLTEEELNRPMHVTAGAVGQIYFKDMKKSTHSDFLRAECNARNIEVSMGVDGKTMHFPRTIKALKEHLVKKGEGESIATIKAFKPTSNCAQEENSMEISVEIGQGPDTDITTEINQTAGGNHNSMQLLQDGGESKSNEEDLTKQHLDESFDAAILNQSFGSLVIGPATPQRRRQKSNDVLGANRLDITMEEDQDEIRDVHSDNINSIDLEDEIGSERSGMRHQGWLSNNEHTSMQSPIRRGLSSAWGAVLGSTKKMKKKIRLGGTPNEIRAGKTQQNESDLPRSVNLFSLTDEP